jgi:UDP-N-acetylglucosamine 4-epimerase
LLRGRRCVINGDGETSRDFCYIDNAVQANLLAATVENEDALGQVYNVAYGASTTLNELYVLIRDNLVRVRPDLSGVADLEPLYGPFRPGDVRRSLADISKAARLLGYTPTHSVERGLSEAVGWYAEARLRSYRAVERARVTAWAAAVHARAWWYGGRRRNLTRRGDRGGSRRGRC